MATDCQSVEILPSPGVSHKQLLIAVLKYLKKALKLNSARGGK